MNTVIKTIVISLFSLSILTACGGGGGGGSGGSTPSTDASLSDLVLINATLDQIFQSSQTSYTASVGFLKTSLQVTAMTNDANASMTINGSSVASGAVSPTFNLAEGINNVNVIVTAEDGMTTQTYTVDVNRQLAATFAQQAYAKASNTDAGDRFGQSVALDGDTMVVGATGEASTASGVNGNQADNSASFAGAVYVFIRSGSSWSQQAYIKASNPDANDAFGWSVALSGDTLAVGARGESSSATGVNGNQVDNSAADAGAVYVFTRTGTSWAQQAYIKASNTDAGDDFGYSLALDDDTLAVSANTESSNATGVNGYQLDNSESGAGAVYVFTRSGTTWAQHAYIKASNTASGDQFGLGLALAGDTLAVGAYLEDSNATGVNGDEADNSESGAGAVYVFARSGSTWAQQAYIKASNTDANDHFGAHVALADDTLAVGAYGEASNAAGINGNQSDNSASDAGAVYVFSRNGTTWGQQVYIKASNAGMNDRFGTRLSLAEDTLAVGAYLEDGRDTGINGDQNLNDAANAGAVYVFTRSGSSWSQQFYVKASNTDAQDQFGYSVAVSSDSLAIGTAIEASSARGVSGDQADNTTSLAGAAYVFE